MTYLLFLTSNRRTRQVQIHKIVPPKLLASKNRRNQNVARAFWSHSFGLGWCVVLAYATSSPTIWNEGNASRGRVLLAKLVSAQGRRGTSICSWYSNNKNPKLSCSPCAFPWEFESVVGALGQLKILISSHSSPPNWSGELWWKRGAHPIFVLNPWLAHRSGLEGSLCGIVDNRPIY